MTLDIKSNPLPTKLSGTVMCQSGSMIGCLPVIKFKILYGSLPVWRKFALPTVCWSVSKAIDASNSFLRLVAPICASAESCDNVPKVPIGSLLNNMFIGE